LVVFLTVRAYIASGPALNGSLKHKQPLLLYSCSGAFVSGLCLANQHSSLLLLAIHIPFVFWLHARRPDGSLALPSLWTLTLLSLCFFIGMSPCTYLYIAAAVPKPGSWGDLTTRAGLLRHLLRSEYGTLQLGMRPTLPGESQANLVPH
jgi:hypothetical protein